CSDEHPMGIFHPHSEVHNIKKENIGLIEVMGLAILPGRLESEMKSIETLLKEENWDTKLKNDPNLSKHYDWIKNIIKNNSNSIDFSILKQEIGKTFSIVLEHAGVFKRDDSGKKAFDKFINTL
ncbi:MAG: galactose-1-phosphate uridylyltransferase, partial [Cetobacterium sp.]